MEDKKMLREEDLEKVSGGIGPEDFWSPATCPICGKTFENYMLMHFHMDDHGELLPDAPDDMPL